MYKYISASTNPLSFQLAHPFPSQHHPKWDIIASRKRLSGGGVAHQSPALALAHLILGIRRF